MSIGATASYGGYGIASPYAASSPYASSPSNAPASPSDAPSTRAPFDAPSPFATSPASSAPDAAPLIGPDARDGKRSRKRSFPSPLVVACCVAAGGLVAVVAALSLRGALRARATKRSPATDRPPATERPPATTHAYTVVEPDDRGPAPRTKTAPAESSSRTLTLVPARTAAPRGPGVHEIDPDDVEVLRGSPRADEWERRRARGASAPEETRASEAARATPEFRPMEAMAGSDASVAFGHGPTYGFPLGPGNDATAAFDMMNLFSMMDALGQVWL